MGRIALIGHTVFTLGMFGVMWTVQMVVYPQFRSVDAGSFVGFATGHTERIVLALALFAPAEILFAGWLWFDTPAAISRPAVFVSGLLLAVGWVATAVWFAPLHGKLGEGYDPARVDQLIATNWLRTMLWAARAGFAVWFLWQVVDRDI